MRHTIALTLLLTLGLITSGTAQEKKTSAPDKTPRLETLVPPETMLIFSTPDVAGAIKKYKDTIPGKFMDYLFSEDFRDLIKNFGAGEREFPDLRRELEKNIKKETGLTLDETLDLFSGEVAFALVNFKMAIAAGQRAAGPPPIKLDLVLKVGWKDTTKGEKLLKAITKNARNIKEYEVAGVKAFTVTSPEPVVPHWAITPSCFILATQKDRLKEMVTALMSNRAIDTPLSADATYQLAAKYTKQDEADIVFHMNWKRLSPLIQLPLMMVAPDAFNQLGLDSLKTISYAIRMNQSEFHDAIFFHTENKERRGLLKILSTPRTETKDGLVMTNSSNFMTPASMNITSVGILAALIIPTVQKGMEHAKEAQCASNLRELHKGVILYMVKYGGRMKEAPKDTGSDLWKKLASDPTDVFGGNMGLAHPILICPLATKHHPNGDYRGPAKPWSEMGSDDFIACDRPENHPDGSICAVRKNAFVLFSIPKGDPDYEKALKDTSD